MDNLLNLFEQTLEISEQLRPGYRARLGIGLPKLEAELRLNEIFKIGMSVPTMLVDIYSLIKGTERSILDQRFMDYVPGYRLINLDELDVEKNKFTSLDLVPSNKYLPFLANYSSDYICVESGGLNGIGTVLHDEGEFVLMHKTPENFYLTIIEFYKQGAYFTDGDGFLDFDFDKSGEIGAQLNPGISYWM